MLMFSQPRLVVGIMVDGLQKNHLDILYDRFNSGGFKKLTGQGVTFENLVCNTNSAGNASDIATITSGTVPYYHGIVSNFVLNRSNNKIESIFKDEAYSGIESAYKLSARNFKASNIVDEIMLSNRGKSKSYVIGLNAEDVIAFAGHAANGVVWMDDVMMKWSSTDYYTYGMPWQALDMNEKGAFKRYIDQPWQPMYQASTYLSATDEKKPKPFEYKNNTKKKNNSTSTILKCTPSANALVAEMALRVFQEHELGADRFVDALMLQFTVRTPGEKAFSVFSMEKEDMYLRLDGELQFLIQKIENKIGSDKVLFALFGNQSNAYSPDELKNNNFQTGYFNANRSMALLSSYLMAIYGHEKWISGYYGKNIYLNKELIAQKEIDLKKMQETIIDFMLEFEGVQSAYAFKELMNNASESNFDLYKIRNSSYKGLVGDIIITFMPGWLEIDDNENPVGESNAVKSVLPVWLYGSKLSQAKIHKQYYITDIAPTISTILKIPFTNANIGSPIEEVVGEW